eukprot:gene3684-4240_t
MTKKDKSDDEHEMKDLKSEPSVSPPEEKAFKIGTGNTSNSESPLGGVPEVRHAKFVSPLSKAQELPYQVIMLNDQESSVDFNDPPPSDDEEDDEKDKKKKKKGFWAIFSYKVRIILILILLLLIGGVVIEILAKTNRKAFYSSLKESLLNEELLEQLSTKRPSQLGQTVSTSLKKKKKMGVTQWIEQLKTRNNLSGKLNARADSYTQRDAKRLSKQILKNADQTRKGYLSRQDLKAYVKDKHVEKSYATFGSSTDGKAVYVPNPMMTGAKIENHQRSDEVWIGVDVLMNFLTPVEKLYILESKMDKWVRAQPEKWKADVSLNFVSIQGTNHITVRYGASIISSWQNVKRWRAIKNELFFKMKEWITDLGIESYPAKQMVQLINGPPNVNGLSDVRDIHGDFAFQLPQ